MVFKAFRPFSLTIEKTASFYAPYKVNIGRARREWKKLTAGEKQRALDNIDEYYDHLNNQKYCKQAATYLADKSFENEYDD